MEKKKIKFSRSTHFWIVKSKGKYHVSSGEPLDYQKYIDFVENHPSEFIWGENTKSGIETLARIDEVPENFKERVLGSLNKISCYKEFDIKKGYYNINCGFGLDSLSIGFERTPKMEDLKIFLAMAKHLDAILLKDGVTIIDETMFEDLK